MRNARVSIKQTYIKQDIGISYRQPIPFKVFEKIKKAIEKSPALAIGQWSSNKITGTNGFQSPVISSVFETMTKGKNTNRALREIERIVRRYVK